jgi:hypothetical protein
MLVILATQEVEIGRITVPGQPGKIVDEAPTSQPVAGTCHPKLRLGSGGLQFQASLDQKKKFVGRPPP